MAFLARRDPLPPPLNARGRHALAGVRRPCRHLPLVLEPGEVAAYEADVLGDALRGEPLGGPPCGPRPLRPDPIPSPHPGPPGPTRPAARSPSRAGPDPAPFARPNPSVRLVPTPPQGPPRWAPPPRAQPAGS